MPADRLVAFTVNGDNPWMAAGWDRVVMLAALLAVGRAAADEPIAVAPAELPVPLAREAAAFARDAAAQARRGLWGWSTMGLAGGAYAGLVLAGRHPGPDWVASLSFVGAIAGVIGGVRSWMRSHELAALGNRLDPVAAGRGAEATMAVDLETRLAFERELFGTRRKLAASARGALRAGCVLPVLLGGIAGYGLLAGRGGEELAGVSLGGALVIGAPSVLSYWGLNARLRRVDALAREWTMALTGREEPTPQHE